LNSVIVFILYFSLPISKGRFRNQGKKLENHSRRTFPDWSFRKRGKMCHWHLWLIDVVFKLELQEEARVHLRGNC
jgi:hypothetical protein